MENLTSRLVEFCRFLRANGFQIGIQETIDTLESVRLVSITERETFQRMVDHDFAICGTVDQVKRKIESLSKCHSNGSLEWFGWSFGQGFLTWPEAQEQLGLFEKHVMPEFRG